MRLIVRYADEALTDLAQIYAYIYPDNPHRAFTYTEEIRAAVEAVADSPFPLAITKAGLGLGPDIRSLNHPTTKPGHTLILKFTGGTLAVLRVLGSPMDLPARIKEGQ